MICCLSLIPTEQFWITKPVICHTCILPPEKFLRRKMQDVLPPEVGRKIADALSELRTGSKVSFMEYFLHTPFGKCWYESRLVPAFKWTKHRACAGYYEIQGVGIKN